jgi:hypothetical protein
MQDKNHIINIGNNSFEMVEQFRYLCNNFNETKLHSKINENKIKLKKLPFIWCRISYLPVLPKNIKIRTGRTIFLYVVLYGCGNWSLTVREKFKLRVFANRVLRRILRPKRDGNRGVDETT